MILFFGIGWFVLCRIFCCVFFPRFFRCFLVIVGLSGEEGGDSGGVGGFRRVSGVMGVVRAAVLFELAFVLGADFLTAAANDNLVCTFFHGSVSLCCVMTAGFSVGLGIANANFFCCESFVPLSFALFALCCLDFSPLRGVASLSSSLIGFCRLPFLVMVGGSRRRPRSFGT
mgnify:CR=1 FL=1